MIKDQGKAYLLAILCLQQLRVCLIDRNFWQYKSLEVKINFHRFFVSACECKLFWEKSEKLE